MKFWTAIFSAFLISTAGSIDTAAAQDTTQPGLLAAGGFLDNPNPDVVLGVGAGLKYRNNYFGSKDMEVVPTGLFRLDYIRFKNGFEFGSNRTVGFREGVTVSGAARFVSERNSKDYSELTGLEDVNWTMELGLGLGYEQRDWRVFGDARYGFFGHHGFVGTLGADVIARPIKGLTLTLGPRMDFGDEQFTKTYFGITPTEAAASQFSAYSPGGGLVSAGVLFDAQYQIDERWGLEGQVAWNRYLGDAANSPITQFGSTDQFQVKFLVTRRISLDF